MIQSELYRELFVRELDSFIPPRVFDAHAHLYRSCFFSGKPPDLIRRFPEMGLLGFLEAMETIIPHRKMSGLFFGWPDPEIDVAANNRFVAEQIRLDPNSRGEMLVSPSMDPEFIRENVRQNRFSGLKCYHLYSLQAPSFDASIPSYLPEEQVRIAHEEGLTITLHIMKARAIADPENQAVIRTWATKYPNAQFILAHAARGFNPHHTIAGISSLHGLKNIWCDTSAVTDGGAFEAIIRSLGVERLLYGGDSPIMHMRGRCVAVGDSFLWLSESNTNFTAPYADIHPIPVGLESLRILKLACWNLGLSETAVEKIFWGNATELFGIR